MDKDNQEESTQRKYQTKGTSITLITVTVLLLLSILPAFIAIGRAEYNHGGNKFAYDTARLLLGVVAIAMIILAIQAVRDFKR